MTSSSATPELASIERLLRERVATYDQLEVLLCLSSGSAEPRSSRDVAVALSKPEAAVGEALNALTKAGLLRQVMGSARFRYEPETPELELAVRELSLMHEQDRVQVIKLMSAQAIARLRTSALRAFARHFRGRSRE